VKVQGVSAQFAAGLSCRHTFTMTDAGGFQLSEWDGGNSGERCAGIQTDLSRSVV